jgi:molybdate transport system ATP-binding protein
MSRQHTAIFTTNESNTSKLIRNIIEGSLPELSFLKGLHGALFSIITLNEFIDEEERHGTKLLTQAKQQTLKTMSSGEQKKALLNHLFIQRPDYIILDNPFDNLDLESQQELATRLKKTSSEILFIQIISRKADLVPFISNYFVLSNEKLVLQQNMDDLFLSEENSAFNGAIPAPLQAIEFPQELLIELKDVTVQFSKKTVIRNINWQINKGELWQLIGENGSGKTTLLSMLTGENPKGYGQELFLFGRKKGSGESIWDIKEKIGYFTPSMTDKFTGLHSIENMLISGFNDSIGLYVKPSEAQLRLTKEWLELLDLWDTKDTLFHLLSIGQKRLIMTTRAMIKHPLLLILDEPTAGLDDSSSRLLVALINKIAKESSTATIFVSHRKEPGLNPDYIFVLEKSESGSTGKAIPNIT